MIAVSQMVVVDRGGHLQSVFLGRGRMRPYSAAARQSMDLVTASSPGTFRAASAKPSSATRRSYNLQPSRGGHNGGSHGGGMKFCPRCPHCLKSAGFGHLTASNGNGNSSRSLMKHAEQEAARLEMEAQKVTGPQPRLQ